MPSQPVLIFDLSRLFGRRNAATPTGIDRVDLRYAMYLKDRPGSTCMFVVQFEGRMLLVPHRNAVTLIQRLWSRWVSGESVENTLCQFDIFGFVSPDEVLLGREEEAEQSAPLETEAVDDFFSWTFGKRFDFLMSSEVMPYVPSSVGWFFSLPSFLKAPVLALAATSAPVLRLLLRLGKLPSRFVGRHQGDAPRRGLSYFYHQARLGVRSVFSGARSANHRAWSASRVLGLDLISALERHQSARIIYVNTSHQGIDNFSTYWALRQHWDVEFIFYIHDIIPVEYPEYVVAGAAASHEKRMRNAQEFGDFFIFNSSATRDAVTKYYDGIGLKVPSNEVAYIGVEEFALDASRRPEEDVVGSSSDPHFVVLGTIEPRKNHLFLLHMWRELAAEPAGQVPKLFVIGKRGWENENVVDLLDRSPSLREHVIELTDISDSTMSRLIRSARALLFPSFSEGWGMPLVEALSMGVPCICSDIPVFHEAGQEVPDYAHPLDYLTWKRLVVEYCHADSASRRSQLDRMAAYQPPAWDEHWGALEGDLASLTNSR